MKANSKTSQNETEIEDLLVRYQILNEQAKGVEKELKVLKKQIKILLPGQYGHMVLTLEKRPMPEKHIGAYVATYIHINEVKE